MKCIYCGSTMRRRRAPLDDCPKRVEYTCRNCGHIHFTVEVK